MSDKKIKILKISIIVFCVSVFILLITNESYALFNKNVKTNIGIKITTLDKMPSKYATDTIKATLGKTGGIIGVTTSNQKVTMESSNIREYRYSGLDVNNYVYFNCQDGKTQNSTNCEVWRILGIFKDEEGTEHIKIVKNNTLNGIRAWDSSNNDWINSDLKDYLNTTYYNSLATNAKDMIEETKYYLGNIVYDTDTAISAYTHERGSIFCSGSCNGGDIWSGNSATWNGNISLMYPSDYGYTASSSSWSSKGINKYDDGVRETSWMNKNANHSDLEWLLSPVSFGSSNVALWDNAGNLSFDLVAYDYGVRPTLNLKSQIRIVDGDGNSLTPYQLSEN